MSVVTGSSNTVYGIDNDLGYVVWKRRFDAALPAATAECPGGISRRRHAHRAGSTRRPRPDSAAAGEGRRLSQGPRRARARRAGRAGGGRARRRSAALRPPARQAWRAAAGSRAGRQRRRATRAPPGPAGAAAQSRPDSWVAAPTRRRLRRPRAPSGVAYVISSDGMLHVIGLPRARTCSVPRRSCRPTRDGRRRWRSTPCCMPPRPALRRSTAAACGPIDLDSDAKPVVSWKTNGGDVVGAVAFATDGTLVAAVGPADHWRRQSQRDRRARPEDAAAEGLVHGAEYASS